MSSDIKKAINRLQKVKEQYRTTSDGVPFQPVDELVVTHEETEARNPVVVEKPEPSDRIIKEVQLGESIETNFCDQHRNTENNIDEREDTKEDAGLINQVSLDYDALHELGLITPKHRVDHLEEEYRILKRPILMNAFGKGAALVQKGNLVMVTSAMPGEGKSFTATNLAMSMATELDSTVLLVDGDVIRASLSKTLNVNDKVGLTDLLEEKVSGLEEVIISTQNPKLKIIPAGLRQSYSTELLASDRMRCFAEELSSRYPDRIILFDAPPLLATTEAVVLTHIMGQVLVVVEAGKSKMDETKAALSKIDQRNVVGLVLNKSRKDARGYYGGYYGGYAH